MKMTDEEARKYIEKIEKDNPPENFRRDNGTINAYLWEKKLLEVLCNDFGEIPSEDENHIITDERRSLKTDLYTYDRHHSKILNLEEEINVKKLKKMHEEEAAALNMLLEKFNLT